MEHTESTQSTHGIHRAHTEHTWSIQSLHGAHIEHTQCTYGVHTEHTLSPHQVHTSTLGWPGLQGEEGPGVYSCPASGFLPPASSEICRIERLLRNLSHHLGKKKMDAGHPTFSSGFVTVGATAGLGSRPLRRHHTVTFLMIFFFLSGSRISIYFSFYALLCFPRLHSFPLLHS